LHTRQYAEAVQLGEKALAMEDFPYSRTMLATAYWFAGRREEAFTVGYPNPFLPEQSRRAREIYEQSGERAMNQWLLKETIQHNPSGSFYARSSLIARQYAALDDKENAFVWIEKAYQERDPWMPMELAYPSWDPLRRDPHFQDLMRRIGITEPKPAGH
jgi:hypothetical protein